jgi:hypothetical protein
MLLLPTRNPLPPRVVQSKTEETETRDSYVSTLPTRSNSSSCSRDASVIETNSSSSSCRTTTSSVKKSDASDIESDCTLTPFVTNTLPTQCFAVNKGSHWSLCVIVNPGVILEHREMLVAHAAPNSSFVPSEEKPFPCLLLFDSLKAHADGKVAFKVRRWLNSEWARLKPDTTTKEQFDLTSMVIYTPKVTLRRRRSKRFSASTPCCCCC